MRKLSDFLRVSEQISVKTTDKSIMSSFLALAMVARKLGIEVDADRLRRELYQNEEEFCLSKMIMCARTVGLRVIGVRPGWRGLDKVSNALPAIIILKDGAAMVLTSIVSEAGCQIYKLQDPLALEEVTLTFSQSGFKSIWGGEVLLVQRGKESKGNTELFDLRWVAKAVVRERGMLRDTIISALMLSLLALTPILFYRLTTERALPFHAMSTFVVVCIVALVLITFEVVFSMLRRHILLRLTTRVEIKIFTEMFSRVLRLPVEYFERTPAGLTMHKIGQIGRIRSFLVGQLFGTVLDAGILLFFVPVMFLFSPLLTSIVIAFAAVICGWIILLLPLYKEKSSAVEAIEAQRGAFISQSIQGIRTVKTLALENMKMSEWDSLTAQLAKLRYDEGNVSNIIQAGVMPLERLMVTGSFGFGVYLAMTSNDPTATTQLFTFMLLSQRLASPLIQASQLVSQFDEARTAIAVVAGLVNQSSEEGLSGNGVRNELVGSVVFSKVLFQYQGALKPALKDVTFEIPRGTTLGVMGRSGSGKTTLTRLLQRLNTDYSGFVKVDGIDVRNYDLHHFRSSLGVVLQENFLFSGTIRSNISMAKPEASFEEVVYAARLAGAEEFIDKLPNGYETYVYEGSPNLSGGQRQRLAIARALITDPKILILDEATSALDAESEAIVNANIERISQGRTVITISHRLASLVKADAILVMEQGEVNDIGRHHELLERNEIYANLWYTQNPHLAAPAAPRPQLTFRGPQGVA